MSRYARFATADYFTGQYKDRTTFMAAILGRLQLEARQDGWTGSAIFDADWIEETGKPDMAVLSLQPSTGNVTIANVRLFLIEKKNKARQQAERAAA